MTNNPNLNLKMILFSENDFKENIPIFENTFFLKGRIFLIFHIIFIFNREIYFLALYITI